MLDNKLTFPNDLALANQKTAAELGRVISHEYVSAQKYLGDLLEETITKILAFREASPDKAIRAGDGIMPASFYVLNRNEQQRDIRTSVAIEDLISEQSAYLVLGNVGLGKTTLCLDLASRLIPSGKGKQGGDLNPDNNYVPVLVRLREIGSKLEQERNKLSQEQKNNPNIDYELLKGILTGGVSFLDVEKLRVYQEQGRRFVFILDGFDELDRSYRDNFSNILRDIDELGTVIVTSRYERFSEYETGNEAYGFARTVHIDPKGVLNNLNNYLEARINDDGEREQLAKFIQRQSPDIRDNWLMVYFIVDIYQREPDALDLEGEMNQSDIMRKGIEWFMWDHAYRRNPLKLFPNPVRNPDESDGEYEARCRELMILRKDEYIREVKPTSRKIVAYMRVNEEPIVPLETVERIIYGKWNLTTEMEHRQGKREKRFLD